MAAAGTSAVVPEFLLGHLGAYPEASACMFQHPEAKEMWHILGCAFDQLPIDFVKVIFMQEPAFV